MIRRICLIISVSIGISSPQLHAQLRNWTKGQVTIRAEFVSQSDGMVTIKKDGREFQIEIATLSGADRDWLAEQAGGGSGEGIYIAVGNGLHRMSSTDGRVWNHVESAGKPAHDQNDLKSVAVGNGVCVTVGGFSRSNILTTTDGISWHKNEFNIGVLSGVIFVDDQFYAFGEGGRVAASKDGMEWNQIGDAKVRDHLQREAQELGLDKPIKSNIRSWRYADGLFVGSGDNGFVLSTGDFEKWSIASRVEPQSRLFIETDGKNFVVKGDQTLHFSEDGINWTDVTPSEGDIQSKLMSLNFDGQRFIANDRGGKGWESKDGKKWEPVERESYPGIISLVRPDLYYSFQNYWQYTETLNVSTDGGKSWEACEIPEPVGVTHVIFAEGLSH